MSKKLFPVVCKINLMIVVNNYINVKIKEIQLFRCIVLIFLNINFIIIIFGVFVFLRSCCLFRPDTNCGS